jgi:hypothetical protein
MMRRGLIFALAVGGVLAGVSGVVPAQVVPDGAVRVGSSGDDAEMLKTIPISRKPGRNPKVAYSIGPSTLGELHSGDRLQGMGEVEVTVCLKHNPLAPGSGSECVGKNYGYNPHVQARVVLGPGSGATSEGRTLTVVPNKRIQCTQSLPNRNHHCVIGLRPHSLDIPDTSSLPCPPDQCHVNLVIDAWHSNAGRGERVVVGSSDSNGRVQDDKGRVAFARFRPGSMPSASFKRAKRRDGSLPISANGHDAAKRVLYSMKLEHLTTGEQLVAEGKLVARIGNQPYSAFITTEVILATKPNATEPRRASGRVTHSNSQIASANGFNCTQGQSAHRNPCVARKLGAVQVERDADRPLYLNLVAGSNAMFPDEKWRPGDRAKITRRSYLRLYRYTPGS